MKHYQVSVFFEYECNGTICGSITDFAIMAYTKEEAQDQAWSNMCEMYSTLIYCEYDIEEV